MHRDSHDSISVTPLCPDLQKECPISISFAGFSKPMAQPAGAAHRVKGKLTPKGSTVANCRINFTSSDAVMRDSVPYTPYPGKAVLEKESWHVVC